MRFVFISICSLVLLFFSACDTSDNSEPTEIVIGLAAPLTGSLTRTGQEMRVSAEMAIDLANEARTQGTPPFRLHVEDSQSTTEGTEGAFKNLIDQGVIFIVGPFTSTNTDHIIPLIDAANVVTIAPASAAQGLGAKSDWLFRSSLTVDILMPPSVQISRDVLGYTNIATLTNEADKFSRSARDEFVKVIDNLSGVSIGATASFNRSGNQAPPDLAPQINALSNAIPRPDVLFFFGLSPDRYNFILKAHELGIKDLPFVVTLLSTSDIRLIRESDPAAAEGVLTTQVWISDSNHSTSRDFVKNFQQRYIDVPNDVHARTYAATDLLLRAFKDVNLSNYSNETIRESLASFKNVDTIYGSFSFDSTGDGVYTPVVGIVRNGNITPLDNTTN